MTVMMTSLCLLFYGQMFLRGRRGGGSSLGLTPTIQVLTAQRQNLNLDEFQISKQISSELKGQEDELMYIVKGIESDTLGVKPSHEEDLDKDKEEDKKKKDKKTLTTLPKNEGLQSPPRPKELPKILPKKEPTAVTKKRLEVQKNNSKSGMEAKEKDKIHVVKLYPEKIQNTTKSYPPHLHPDRFKFIYKKERLSKDGPKVNLFPEQITFRHDLQQTTYVCNSTDPLILAVVVSAVKKKELREYIRRTWANPRLYPYAKIRTVFVIGLTPNTALQEEVDKEYTKYNDIIQYNHIDSYETLTYKSLALLKWVGKHCPQAKFIAKIDDDVMVNPFHLRAYFEDKLKNPPVAKGASNVQQANGTNQTAEDLATSYIYGRYDGVPYPMRYSKWGVTKEEYPEGNYPPFVHGPAYVVGRTAARLLLEYAPYVPFLKLEDVYTTGLLAHAAQVRHVQINGEINTFKASSKLYNGTQALLEETNSNSRREAWEGISLYAPVDIKALGTPWT